MHAGVIHYVLLFVANPYSYTSIYKENQGIEILPKNNNCILRKTKSKKIPKEASRSRKSKDRQCNSQMKKKKGQITISKASQRNIRYIFYHEKGQKDNNLQNITQNIASTTNLLIYKRVRVANVHIALQMQMF